ncbi:hypothetical protein AJ79_05812 [Helicocarpus griseus UAMH5409]|uniref:Uncharacterized protein n=1 Tax=Helicocarpus griseus UAMH5409 TaxID=1447875 RepID=A0A2B7XK97_9EURO|nr:hypothetical protein AJ79_05812 [Helicocarpus griseus UAMH5409]
MSTNKRCLLKIGSPLWINPAALGRLYPSSVAAVATLAVHIATSHRACTSPLFPTSQNLTRVYHHTTTTLEPLRVSSGPIIEIEYIIVPISSHGYKGGPKPTIIKPSQRLIPKLPRIDAYDQEVYEFLKQYIPAAITGPKEKEEVGILAEKFCKDDRALYTTSLKEMEECFGEDLGMELYLDVMVEADASYYFLSMYRLGRDTSVPEFFVYRHFSAFGFVFVVLRRCSKWRAITRRHRTAAEEKV